MSGTFGIAFLRDIGTAELVRGGIDIVALPCGNDLPQRLQLGLRAPEDAERHGAFILCVIAFGGVQRNGTVVIPYGRFEFAVGIADVAQPVVGIGAVAVAGRIGFEELLERTARPGHVLAREIAVAEVVERHGIFVLAAGGTLQVGVVFGRSDRIVALCEGDFALPEGVERTVFGADIDGRGFGQVTLRGTHVTGAVRLQTAEIGDLLQCGTDIGILCREGFDGPVSRVVIVRIVVGRDQQRTGFAHARRIGILSDIARQYVDRAVEGTAAQLVLQFAVVEQRVFGDGRIELVVRCHGERLHGRLFIPGTQVTVCQVVRGILRQCILGTAGLAQELHGLGIACRAVKREAHQVAAVTVEFAAGSRKGVQVPDGLVIVAQVKPRFGDDTLQFLPAFGHGTARQFVAVFDNIAVVSVAEFDLQEVIRHHGTVGIAALQGREALLRTPVASLGIVDIGFVIECVVGILTLGADAVEITERLVVIAFGELDIAHADVVLFLARPAQRLVIGL